MALARYAPRTTYGEIENDVLAEVVTVLNCELHRALDVRGTLLEFGLVAVEV